MLLSVTICYMLLLYVTICYYLLLYKICVTNGYLTINLTSLHRLYDSLLGWSPTPGDDRFFATTRSSETLETHVSTASSCDSGQGAAATPDASHRKHPIFSAERSAKITVIIISEAFSLLFCINNDCCLNSTWFSRVKRGSRLGSVLPTSSSGTWDGTSKPGNPN